MTRRPRLAFVFAIVAILAVPAVSFAQVRVIISGGFSAAYREALPEFERSTGIRVATTSGASQGAGPDTIGAQLRRGDAADVVILSREGLDELIAGGRIVAGSDVDLAVTLIGLAVRAGAPAPDIGTIDAFRQALLTAKTIAVPSSTGGLYVINALLPRLGIADRVVVKTSTRGAAAVAMVAAGDAAVAIQPVSELLSAPGVEFVGAIPAGVQFESVYSAAIVAGSANMAASRRLLAFLSSERAAAAITKSGMTPSRR